MRAHDDRSIPALALSLPLAVGLWGWTFGLSAGNFWGKIAVSAAVLALISLWAMGERRGQLFRVRRGHLALGLGSAVVLYGLFWVGKALLTALLPFAGAEIAQVYAKRSELSPAAIALLLLFVTGPAEEIYWRGLVQRALMRRIGPMVGLFLAASLYALVHIWAGNVTLMLAAFVAGLVWGWIFLVERSLVPVIVSHALWSVLIFVVAPLD